MISRIKTFPKNPTTPELSRSWSGVVIYLLVIAAVSLWPFNFDFEVNQNHAQWKKDGGGMEFRKRGQLVSEVPAKRFHEQLAGGSGLTVEVWIRPYEASQEGPARIVSYSMDTSLRNFSLAQSGEGLVMRLRTTGTDLNGMNPHFEAPRVFHDAAAWDRPRHIAFTYDCHEACFYVDGRRHRCDRTIEGDFLDWDPDHRLVIGNEVTSDRPWLGEIHHAAIHNRALTPTEIADAFLRGWQPTAGPKCPDRLACYTFDENLGTTVADKAGGSAPLPLHIPGTLPPFPFDLSGRTVLREFLPSNLIPNVAIFIPLGFLILGQLKRFTISGREMVPATLLLGLFIAFAIECLQHYQPAKHSSTPELFMKFAGFSLGMAMRLRTFDNQPEMGILNSPPANWNPNHDRKTIDP